MMKVVGQNDLQQLHQIPVEPPKRDKNLQYYHKICSRKEILRTIEKFICDIRSGLLAIEGVDIIRVTPSKLYVFRRGTTVVFPPVRAYKFAMIQM